MTVNTHKISEIDAERDAASEIQASRCSRRVMRLVEMAVYRDIDRQHGRPSRLTLLTSYDKCDMDVDTASDNTSIDDKIDDFCENPTRDALTEGLMNLLKPTVDQLDERIRATRICQIELKQRIESLTEELQKINDALQYPLETDSYVKKLINAKHKITIVSNILQTTQERLNKVHQAVEKSTARRKVLLDSCTCTGVNVEPDKEQPGEAAAAIDKQ